MMKFLKNIVIAAALVMTPAVAVAQSCATSEFMQEYYQDSTEIKYVMSFTDEQMIKVNEALSAEFNQPMNVSHVDIYAIIEADGTINTEDVVVVLFNSDGCFYNAFRDSKAHVEKLLGEEITVS